MHAQEKPYLICNNGNYAESDLSFGHISKYGYVLKLAKYPYKNSSSFYFTRNSPSPSRSLQISSDMFRYLMFLLIDMTWEYLKC